MNTASFSNYLTTDYDPKHAVSAAKGKNAIAVLAIGQNEPKGQENTGNKVAKVVLENYMRRPSLREEALQKLTEFAHDAVCVQQAPGYPVECSVGMLLTQGSQFRWVCTGDVRILHFVNGQMMESSNGSSAKLGSGQSKEMPEVLPVTEFQKGENSFLLCSESFLRYVQPREIEDTLSLADNPGDWLRALKDLYEDRCADEPFALMTVFMPEKRKRMPKKAVIAIIITLVVLAVAFFVLGATRRRQGPGGPGRPGGPGGPGQQQMQPGAPGMEPTEPPAPSEGQGGNPGERPTQPPKPTEPPAPEAPGAEGADGEAAGA